MTKQTSDEVSTDQAERRYSHDDKVVAARIRVKVDKVRGVDTPQWIRDLAAEKAS